MKPIFTILLMFAALCSFATPHHHFAAPTTPASNLVATSNDGDRINLSWTNGNGSKRIIIARKDFAVTAVPVNGVNYIASNSFGAGNEISPGEFVVYNGNNSNATVLNLQGATTYHFAIFELNGSGASIEYLATPAVVSGSTIHPPAGQPANLSVSQITGHSMRISWTNPPSGTAGNGRLVLVKENAPVNANPVDLVDYSANNSFGSGTEIGSGNFVIYQGNQSSATVDNLKPGTTYHFAIFEYKGSNGLVFNISNPPSISASSLPRPASPATQISYSHIEGNSMKLTITKGSGARRLVIGKAGSPVTALPQDGQSYTANSVFGSGQQVAPGEFVLMSGSSDNVTVTNLAPATTYHFAVFEYDGTGVHTAYLSASFLASSGATVSAPTLASNNIVVSNVSNNSFTLNWTKGNGAKRLVVVRKTDPVNVLPVDLTSYAGNGAFGTGSHLGSGNYAVYANTGSSVTVTNLMAGSLYHVAIFEYNGNNDPVYLTTDFPVTSVSTSLAPSLPASAIEFKFVEGNRMSLEWQNGNGSRRIVVAKAGGPVTAVPGDQVSYTASSVFGSGEEIAPGEFVVFNSNSAAFTLTNLQPATSYHFAIFEYNTVNNINYYLTTDPARSSRTTAAAPTTNSSGLSFPTISGSSLKLSWTKGNGAGRLVIARAGSPVDVVPTDLHSYSDNNSFGSGTQIGNGNYVVYKGSADNFTLLSLDPGVTYHFAVFEYNGSSFPVYLTTNVLAGSQATNERPVVAASAFNFSGIEGNKLTVRWTNGNGSRRILVGKQGGPVTGLPLDGVDYHASAVFGNGQQIAPGEFVLYDNTLAEVTVSHLSPGTEYHFAVFEYDGTGNNTRYLTTSFPAASQPTLSAPTQQAGNVLFSAVGASSVTVNWTVGNGDRRLVIMRKGAPVNAIPQNLQQYSASANNTSSSTAVAGDNYAVYNNSASNVTVNNLTPGTTYYFAVYEFNGFSGPVYLQSNPATGLVTTLGPPSEPATNLMFTNMGNHTLKIEWLNGSGQKRLVLAKENGPVDALPQNNVSYTANTFFGSGDQIGSGNYVVFNGTADQVTISNLQAGKSYHFAVFEYNQFVTGSQYLVSNPATGVFAGFVLPVKLVSFTGEVQGQSNRLVWKTASETNTKEFIVERSANGVDYEDIGKVNAKGNSGVEQVYGFVDNNRLPLAYYRLHIVDFDGHAEHSAVVRLKAGNGRQATVRLYPMPAVSSLQITMEHDRNEPADIAVADMNGRQVLARQTQLKEGNNQFGIDISSLVSGNYILTITTAQSSQSIKFIKQ